MPDQPIPATAVAAMERLFVPEIVWRRCSGHEPGAREQLFLEVAETVAPMLRDQAVTAERSRLWVAIRHAGIPQEFRGQVLDMLWPIFAAAGEQVTGQSTTEEAKATDLAKALLDLADAGDMPDTYWRTDSRVQLAREVLGVPEDGRYTHEHLWSDDG